jgi:hypothetical protein
MVKKETIEFVEKNLELLEFVRRHGSPNLRKIAEALILAYLEVKENEEYQNRE